MLHAQDAREKMNKLGAEKCPFLCLISFDMSQNRVIPLSEIDPEELLFKFNDHTNYSEELVLKKPLEFNISPPDYATYKHAFDQVYQNLRQGNSYLVNLTMPSALECNYSLKEIFFLSQSMYKLWYNDQFVFFSPEIFVKIMDGKISSFPMKGTMDASIENAHELLIQNQKELAEHNTIVDLIRNDLNMVAKKVRVEKFRYIDEIKTSRKNILQVSSKITGHLNDNYAAYLGDIIYKMLPAGSVSGAPKQKTCEIIREAEPDSRGFYTGIAGVFDGENFDSCVIIRYIENSDKGKIYRSGGGITINSQCKSEYQELIDKIYVPFNRKYQS